MLEEYGDIWSMHGDYICIPTSAILRNKVAVMGKGIALDAAKKNPGIGKILGKLIDEKGHHVYHLGNGLISFPTRWHFAREADITLIKQSAQELVDLLKEDPATRILLARPGDGSLEWLRIKPVIEKILSDNKFIIVAEPKKLSHKEKSTMKYIKTLRLDRIKT